MKSSVTIGAASGYSYHMSNLVPEPRVDVNGRVVTRHIRADSPAGPPKGRVPVLPSGVRSDSHQAVIDIVYNTLLHYGYMRSASPIYNSGVRLDRKTVTSYFEGIPKDIIDECLDQALASETDTGYDALLLSAVHRREDQNMLSNITFLYDPDNENISEPDWDHEHSIADNHLFLRRVVKGMEKYTEWGLALPPRFRLASRKQQGEILALYRTTDFISFALEPELLFHGRDTEGAVTSLSLKDRVMFNAVVSHPDRTDEIISIIESRGCNGEFLEEYFSSTPPLRPGVL